MSHVDAPKLRPADNGEAVGVGHREAIAHEERLPELAVSLWLITHPDLRKVARIRAALDVLAAGLVAHRPLLKGTGGENAR